MWVNWHTISSGGLALLKHANIERSIWLHARRATGFIIKNASTAREDDINFELEAERLPLKSYLSKSYTAMSGLVILIAEWKWARMKIYCFMHGPLSPALLSEFIDADYWPSICQCNYIIAEAKLTIMSAKY